MTCHRRGNFCSFREAEERARRRWCHQNSAGPVDPSANHPWQQSQKCIFGHSLPTPDSSKPRSRRSNGCSSPGHGLSMAVPWLFHHHRPGTPSGGGRRTQLACPVLLVACSLLSQGTSTWEDGEPPGLPSSSTTSAEGFAVHPEMT